MDASGPLLTIWPVSASNNATWMPDPCSPSTLLPVKRGSANLFLNCSRKFRWSGPCILFGKDLQWNNVTGNHLSQFLCLEQVWVGWRNDFNQN
jgi:hypothetical protein